MPGILDRYIALRFIAIYLASLISFSLIFVLVDSFSQYSSLMNKAGDFGNFFKMWLNFYTAQVPIFFSRALGPITTTASAAFTVTMFVRANELAPILSAGVSLQRQIAPVLILTVMTAVGSALVQEIWIPANRSWIQEAKGKGRGRQHVRHIKYYDQKQRILVVLRFYYLRELRGDGLLVIPLEGHSGPRFILEARRIKWMPEKRLWMLEDGFIQEYSGEDDLFFPEGTDAPGTESKAQAPRKKPEDNRLLRTFEKMPLKDLVEIEMLPQDLQQRQSMELYLWMDELLEKVKRSPNSIRWRVRLYGRIVDPIHAIILVLLGIPAIFIWGTRNIFLSAIAVVVISSLYFVTYLVFLNMGNQGLLTPGLAAGLAPVFYGALGITLYAKMRS